MRVYSPCGADTETLPKCLKFLGFFHFVRSQLPVCINRRGKVNDSGGPILTRFSNVRGCTQSPHLSLVSPGPWQLLKLSSSNERTVTISIESDYVLHHQDYPRKGLPSETDHSATRPHTQHRVTLILRSKPEMNCH
jgi:hypothetical protein